MNTLYKRSLVRVLSLFVALTLGASSVFGAEMFYNTNDSNPSKWKAHTTATQDGDVYTATLTGLTVGSQYYIALSLTDSYTGVYTSTSTECSYIVNSGIQVDGAGKVQVFSQNYNIGDNRYQYLRLMPSVSSLVVAYNNATHVYTFTAADASITVSTAGTNCTISPSSANVAEGKSAVFTVTMDEGYEFGTATIPSGTGSVEVSADKTTVTVTPTTNTTLTVTGAIKKFDVTASCPDGGGDVTPKSAKVNYGASQTFSVNTVRNIDVRNTIFTGDAVMEIATAESGFDITLSNVKSAGDLLIYFTADANPIVFIAAYPTQSTGLNANLVNLNGYLTDRQCMTVKRTGFYWSTSKEITLGEVKTALSGGAGDSHIIDSESVPDKSGSEFSRNDYNLNLQETQVIYFVAFAVTDGGTAISRPTGFEYVHCAGINALTLTPSSASAPVGYNVELTAVPRGAGKTPVYEWYKKEGSEYVLIQGQTSYTYNFTKSSESTENIKVKVSESACGTSMEAEATIDYCPTPVISSLVADKAINTPWQDVVLTAEVSNSTSGTWSVSPDAEIVDTTAGGTISAVFNGPVKSGNQTVYTVTYTAKGGCVNTDVEVSRSIDITIVKDTEVCD